MTAGSMMGARDHTPLLLDGGTLRALRRARALSVRKLARRARVAPRTIARLEAGAGADVRLDVLGRLRDGLGVGVLDLLRA